MATDISASLGLIEEVSDALQLGQCRLKVYPVGVGGACEQSMA